MTMLQSFAGFPHKVAHSILLLLTISNAQGQLVVPNITWTADYNETWGYEVVESHLRSLQMDQDRDSGLDDDDNLILDGAANSDFNTATKAAGNEDKDAVSAEELEAIRKKAGKPAINVGKESKNDWETNDIKERYERGDITLTIDSVTPRAGPTTGFTKVNVRGDFENLIDAFPSPKCRFGMNSMVVDGQYVRCTRKPLTFYEREKSSTPKDSVCIMCEESPKSATAEIVTFSISLTGNFDDITSSLPYRYYAPAKVHSIYPRYGPKDGDTVVQVWGENFLDLGDDFRCNFGTRATKAYLINDKFLWCRAPMSDVVGRSMPFSISLNRQQNSLSDASYWYYSEPQISKITPDFGAMSGGTKVLLQGSGFLPFDWKRDINNQNDTFCLWGPLGKTPAQVLSSTTAECLTPPNTQHISWTWLNLTLNNQNYTEELQKFYYFNPPKIMDAEPLIGPVAGGTEVNLWGTKFEKNKNITCSFGDKVVRAKFISKSHLICKAPQVLEPGTVKLTVKYQNDRFQSDVLTYEYFDTPEITGNLVPSCGPVGGYTQFLVKGKNFIEFGYGKAKCIFNGTIQMNATVLDQNRLYCDSPPLDVSSGDTWYNVSVSLDGNYFSPATQNFTYYDQPVINSVSPWLGPLKGNTKVTIAGSGFNQSNICDLVVRFGQEVLTVRDVKADSLVVDSPAGKVPGEVVVSMAGNRQQYIDDRTLHFRDKENTFEYYQALVLEKAEPQYLSNAGNSPLTLTAAKFDQFTYDNGTFKNVDYLCRFDSGDSIKMIRLNQNQQVCVAPKTDDSGDVKVEISLNAQDWEDTESAVKFYSGPMVTRIDPQFGVTKNPKNLKMSIFGDNFACPENDCSRIKVRFMNKDKDSIIVEGHMTESNSVICDIPKYPAPETLDVDVSFNGLDFTNDGIKYGFFDPYIEDVQPRLISPKGTTQLNVTGYGFVQMEDGKSLIAMRQQEKSLLCGGAACSKTYLVKSENQALVGTISQDQVEKSEGGNIGFESWNINMMNPDGDYTPNNINLYYYEEPTVDSLSSSFAFANEQKIIVLKAQFNWGTSNNLKIFQKHANVTCRFTSDNDESKQVVTKAIFEATPIGQFQRDSKPDQIRCRTPKWHQAEDVRLEVSVNGQDYFGSQIIKIVENLQIHRIVPMSGPIGGSTKVSIYSEGINSSIPVSSSVFVKFGTIEAQDVDKSQVIATQLSFDSYYNELHLSKKLLKKSEENNLPLEDYSEMLKYVAATTPDLSRIYSYDNPDILGMGGPVAIQIGERVSLDIIDHKEDSSTYLQQVKRNVDVVFKDSSQQEFFFYRQPIVKKIEPMSGLVDGGTVIDVTGIWFDEKPQYGVFPFCKIGENIIRGKFIQTTRIQCKSPPQPAENAGALPVQISLNGIDFSDTGFTFSYYQKPVLLDIRPRSGSIEGGTEIWLKGEKFSNVTNGLKTVKCRFTQIIPEPEEGVNSTIDTENVPVRYIPAYMIDHETMKCASPSGWGGGDQVWVDLTFNGVDYTENRFVFSFYNIFGSFPKSGPVDADNSFIQIRGKGFREESTILCSLNNTKVAPLAIHSGIIKCPMMLDGVDHNVGDSVPFAVMIDGSRFSFGNFHYYKQIEIENVLPLIGPQEGRGAIYIIGKDFRDDYENAKLGCRFGNQLGHAQLVDQQTIRCTIVNKLPLVEQGDTLLVSAALNSYSWAPSEFSYMPYGIHAIYPNSGPIGEDTNILVTGKGFDNDLQDQARCKFGTEENYAIVEAQVLDNEHLVCKAPSDYIDLPEGADQTISMPFSIAFQEDLYYPYTEGTQKYRLYQQPVLTDIDPIEAQVGKLTEVYITADDDNGFWQPMPLNQGEINDQYGIKCKFGRFGTTSATFINMTTILCLTPNIEDDPADISTEVVSVSVAMNGVDFDESNNYQNFQFNGTGGSISTWVIIMGTIIFGLLLISIGIFINGFQDFMRARAFDPPPRVSNVVQGEMGGHQLRPASRASSGNLGQPRGRMYGTGSRQFGGSRSNAGASRANDLM